MPIALAWRTGIMLGICREGSGMLFRWRIPDMRGLFAVVICCWLGIEPGSGRCS
jgi:hypothetical protein